MLKRMSFATRQNFNLTKANKSRVFWWSTYNGKVLHCGAASIKLYNDYTLAPVITTNARTHYSLVQIRALPEIFTHKTLSERATRFLSGGEPQIDNCTQSGQGCTCSVGNP